MSASNFQTPVTTTPNLDPNRWLFEVVFDEGKVWIVSERSSNVYGTGDTLLEAMADFYLALRGVCSALEGRPLSARLVGELAVTRRLLRATAPAPKREPPNPPALSGGGKPE